MQDQENIKNQEEQENQLKEDNGAMTKLQDVFNLAHDQAHPDKIDATIRANTRVTGTSMWVLMFAIAVYWSEIFTAPQSSTPDKHGFQKSPHQTPKSQHTLELKTMLRTCAARSCRQLK